MEVNTKAGFTYLQDVLIWDCTKAIEGITIEKSTAFHWDHQGEGTLCDAKPKGSTEGST